MAMQVLGQSGGSSLFSSNTNLNMALSNDMYDFSELSKAELAAPQLIMLANVALTGEVNGNCCGALVALLLLSAMQPKLDILDYPPGCQYCKLPEVLRWKKE
uniref:Uncharacterized protein n=1 Tax=Naja naja TaxID=35670 RepID=A0A8C6XRL8_NAJNA